MKERTLTCEEKINEELKSRIIDFENALNGKYEDEYEDFIEWLNSYTLAYCDNLFFLQHSDDPTYSGKRLELSYGGPQDYFVFLEDDSIIYRFLDWFDGATRYLHGHNYDIMKRVYDEYLNI